MTMMSDRPLRRAATHPGSDIDQRAGDDEEAVKELTDDESDRGEYAMLSTKRRKERSAITASVSQALTSIAVPPEDGQRPSASKASRSCHELVLMCQRALLSHIDEHYAGTGIQISVLHLAQEVTSKWKLEYYPPRTKSGLQERPINNVANVLYQMVARHNNATGQAKTIVDLVAHGTAMLSKAQRASIGVGKELPPVRGNSKRTTSSGSKPESDVFATAKAPRVGSERAAASGLCEKGVADGEDAAYDTSEEQIYKYPRRKCRSPQHSDPGSVSGSSESSTGTTQIQPHPGDDELHTRKRAAASETECRSKRRRGLNSADGYGPKTPDSFGKTAAPADSRAQVMERFRTTPKGIVNPDDDMFDSADTARSVQSNIKATRELSQNTDVDLLKSQEPDQGGPNDGRSTTEDEASRKGSEPDHTHASLINNSEERSPSAPEYSPITPQVKPACSSTDPQSLAVDDRNESRVSRPFADSTDFYLDAKVIEFKLRSICARIKSAVYQELPKQKVSLDSPAWFNVRPSPALAQTYRQIVGRPSVSQHRGTVEGNLSAPELVCALIGVKLFGENLSAGAELPCTADKFIGGQFSTLGSFVQDMESHLRPLGTDVDTILRRTYLSHVSRAEFQDVQLAPLADSFADQSAALLQEHLKAVDNHGESLTAKDSPERQARIRWAEMLCEPVKDTFALRCELSCARENYRAQWFASEAPVVDGLMNGTHGAGEAVAASVFPGLTVERDGITKLVFPAQVKLM